MAVTDVQAVNFCNQKVRLGADLLCQLYHYAKVYLEIWNQQGLAAKIPNDSTVITDGAATDGRPTLTGAQVYNINARLFEFVTDQEASSNAKLNTELAVSPNPTR